MAYRVIFSDQVDHDIQSLLDEDLGRYKPAERLAYVTDMKRRTERLVPFPQHGTPVTVRGLEHWRMIHKAHTVYYRV